VRRRLRSRPGGRQARFGSLRRSDASSDGVRCSASRDHGSGQGDDHDPHQRRDHDRRSGQGQQSCRTGAREDGGFPPAGGRGRGPFLQQQETFAKQISTIAAGAAHLQETQTYLRRFAEAVAASRQRWKLTTMKRRERCADGLLGLALRLRSEWSVTLFPTRRSGVESLCDDSKAAAA
jgi:hypothetical protein